MAFGIPVNSLINLMIMLYLAEMFLKFCCNFADLLIPKNVILMMSTLVVIHIAAEINLML